LREAEAAKKRKEAERRARHRALLLAPVRFAQRRVPQRGRTGRIRSRRDRAQVAAVSTGLLLALIVVFVTVQSWALRIGAIVLAFLLAPVLVLLTQPRRVH
jgi:Flp pilus assembly protein TadB